MKKVPSKLKKLAELRSRLTAEIERCAIIADDFDNRIYALQSQIEELRTSQRAFRRAINEKYQQIYSIDQSIKQDFPNVDPAKIQPTYSFKKEYGRRGKLTSTILDAIAARNPMGATTSQIAEHIYNTLGIKHPTAREKKKWSRNSLYPAIGSLRERGIIKSIGRGTNSNLWVLHEKSSSFDELLLLPHETSG